LNQLWPSVILKPVLEITLNLVWLVVSLALAVGFGFRVARGADHHRGVAAVALVCLVCFLFPVISMTDDLYCDGPAILDPSKLKKFVVSVPVVLTLLPWLTFQKPQENRWAPLGLPPDTQRTSQEVFAFETSRRPPPLPPVSA
jgi:hypothetical protein